MSWLSGAPGRQAIERTMHVIWGAGEREAHEVLAADRVEVDPRCHSDRQLVEPSRAQCLAVVGEMIDSRVDCLLYTSPSPRDS